jgi:hypothetical protein
MNVMRGESDVRSMKSRGEKERRWKVRERVSDDGRK